MTPATAGSARRPTADPASTLTATVIETAASGSTTAITSEAKRIRCIGRREREFAAWIPIAERPRRAAWPGVQPSSKEVAAPAIAGAAWRTNRMAVSAC